MLAIRYAALLVPLAILAYAIHMLWSRVTISFPL